MCEILAVAGTNDVAFDDILPWARDLERLGVAGFGWGVVWLTEDGVRRYRNPGSLADDAEGARRIGAVRSRRLLVHLRRPSRLSTAQLADSQPFLDASPEEGVGSFAFCHNGFLERHAELRPRYEKQISGRADSEVGFAFFRERLGDGAAPAVALVEVHQRFEGNANLGYLGADGTLLVYGGHAHNPLWQFEQDGLDLAASGLHSDDESLFHLVFTAATRRTRIGAEVIEIGPRPSEDRRAS